MKEKKLSRRYRALDRKVTLRVEPETAVRADVLLTFPYEYPDRECEVVIDTEEFQAVCPWTGLPDQGTLTVAYTPAERLLELKSLKYYLLTFRSVGIVQEHAALRILADLAAAVQPRRMSVTLDYQVRGGLHTRATARLP